MQGVWVHYLSRIWYKMSGGDLERANFHLIVNDDDAIFMTDLVIGHEENSCVFRAPCG